MDILNKMNQSHFFSNSENIIIKHLLDNPNDIINATTKDIAQKTFTSPSTVVRLAQKLGFQGYNDFKIEFLSAVRASEAPLLAVDANFPFKKDNSIPEISSNLSLLITDAIKETDSLVDEAIYEKAIELLDKAKFIDIYGSGVNQHLAYNFMLDMRRINKEVSIAENHQELMVRSTNSNPERASLIISYTGETKEIIEYCQVLKQTGSPMICITSVGHNSISDLCDLTLKIVTREKMFSKISTFSSRVSILMILDILYAGLFARNYDQNIEQTIQRKMRATDFRSKVRPLVEDV
ncbi:MurR/RpiR family transcriptional regulator [Enterococcus sp. 669A]|uniref:MurR/RpiR family transcriptional regulator n=1 Tax=Candidatus Enterococcus moelleringii TaxID=2815325 RepID=A0ABS3LC34_9ENTE|nr:MurR/RpiR family transcriptional regulator [Enterococcus sp. 669A]MBO1306286.1 MurR/RpiR family transcriptional regulator [Enterococcus sp. 669A]